MNAVVNIGADIDVVFVDMSVSSLNAEDLL